MVERPRKHIALNNVHEPKNVRNPENIIKINKPPTGGA